MKSLILIIVIIVLIFSIAGLIYFKNLQTRGGRISLFVCIGSFFSLYIMFLIYIISRTDISNFIGKYNRTNYLIEVYDISKDENLVQLTDLLKDINYINEEINSNRNNKDNLYIGCFYSEKIAELELINLENLKLN